MSRQLPRAGALPQPDGLTRFALWAPDARRVDLQLGDGSRLPMQALDDGWYSLEIPCAAGSAYRFCIDERLSVADPASRVQAGGVEADSLVLDHTAYAWQSREWRGRPWHETVLYELHVGLFDGFTALLDFLPGLVELGVTAIELMPLGAFPGRRNWGYDGVLPYAPAAAYGTPENLKRLIDQAHLLGLMVFVDVVYNHFGPQGNYLGEYASGFFGEQPTPWGHAIDFARPAVREFFIGNAEMWVRDYRVDGLRLDAVHAIADKDFLVELAGRARAAAQGRHLHLVLENEDNQASLLRKGFDAQWNDDLHHVLHHLLTGEREGYYADYAEATTAKLCACLGEGFVFQGQRDHRGRARGEPSAGLPPLAFVAFLQNHDQVGNRALGERLVALSRPERLRVAVALVLLAPMVPMLFMGEEWGERNPFLYFTDYQGELAKAVSDGRRQEFAAFGRFSGAIPEPNDYETFVASRPRPEHADGNWRAHYRRLLELRHAWLIPRLGGTRALGAVPLGEAAVSARWRLGDGSLWRIEFNLGSEQVFVEAPAAQAQILFCEGQEVADYRAGRLAPGSLALSLEESP
ncbi:malto-oligosyltrehalose trehalohydrolase [Pseudomonas citronellolis]|uniref:Malto-oligosyltrehalose trehalohydrolase n=1 Tax=Pseudomonas citronellolis TaxID=53408 RepID=A0A1A9KBU0_9PSED|nr:malto-oligosyltrehalose trehalohydrolase [Pseudomonas citronellolis]ANI14939.1 malto-oligosyltrehalose trehalohydrolase [Pseudomonas citronellolis]